MKVFRWQIGDRYDHDAGPSAVDLVRDVSYGAKHPNAVVSQVSLDWIVIEYADRCKLVAWIFGDHVQRKHSLTARANDDRWPRRARCGKRPMTEIASHPVLQALDYNHHRSSGDGYAGRNQQLTSENEFSDPHDSDAKSDNSGNCGELIRRTSTISAAINGEGTADEKDEKRNS
nr:hypothetical protein [Brevibacterium aurantiacum]